MLPRRVELRFHKGCDVTCFSKWNLHVVSDDHYKLERYELCFSFFYHIKHFKTCEHILKSAIPQIQNSKGLFIARLYINELQFFLQKDIPLFSTSITFIL